MTPAKVEEALAELRRAVDGLFYRGKGANATDEDSLRDEVYTEIDPYVTDLEVELATLTAALAESERDAARYRWLRDNKWADIFYRHDHETHKHDANSRFCCDLLDTAIDAMKDTDHAR